MATYYINADSGNDSTGDGSSGNPWLTLSKAVTSSTTDDTIICQDATATYTWSTQTVTSRTIQGQTYGSVVFDAAAGAPIWTAGAGTTVIENIIFQNAIATSTTSPLFPITAAVTLTFTTCKFTDIQLTFNGSGGAGLIGSTNGSHSVTATMTFNNCLFDDLHGASATVYLISARHNSPAVITYIFNNCTLYFLQSGAQQVVDLTYLNAATSTYNITITNCIIANFTGGTIDWEGGFTSWDSTTLSYSTFYLMTGVPAGTANITTDPLFVDAGNGNFDLRPTSPALGVGTLV